MVSLYKRIKYPWTYASPTKQTVKDVYDISWWDTVPPNGAVEPKGRIKSAIHYGYTSGIIAKAFYDIGHYPKSVLDIASGTGRWLDWYSSQFSASICGIEINKDLVIDSRSRGYTVYEGDAVKVIRSVGYGYDTINAVGIMHHVLPDDRREILIEECKDRLSVGGVLIVGGYFLPWQVQYTNYDGLVYKRCWPKRRWKKIMKGFDVLFYQNPTCHKNNLPQNNILIAKKH